MQKSRKREKTLILFKYFIRYAAIDAPAWYLGLCRSLFLQIAKEILSRLNGHINNVSFYDSIQQEYQYVIVSFFGRLDNTIDYDEYAKKLGPVIYQKECILDFSYCTYIDNAGFGFLLNLKKNLPKRFISLKIYGLNRMLKKTIQDC